MKFGHGIYQRGGIYWLSFQKNGQRRWVTLQTTDPAVALDRAADVRAGLNESIPDAGGLRVEIDRFIAERSGSGKWSRDTTRVHVFGAASTLNASSAG